MDAIFINGLVFSGRHGVYPEEHERDQRFGVAIEAKIEDKDREESLSNTFDYMEAREISRRIVEERSFKLIETIGETIASEVLAHPLVKEVTVTVLKLDVAPPAHAGVTLVRSN
jgi:7,8-dihydroneopterin aldolase/epimerase/oxygenase